MLGCGWSTHQGTHSIYLHLYLRLQCNVSPKVTRPVCKTSATARTRYRNARRRHRTLLSALADPHLLGSNERHAPNSTEHIYHHNIMSISQAVYSRMCVTLKLKLCLCHVPSTAGWCLVRQIATAWPTNEVALEFASCQSPRTQRICSARIIV